VTDPHVDAVPTNRPARNSLFELQPGGDGHYGLDLTGDLARFDGRLFGGAGLAASVAAMEAESGRGALWATVQFVGFAEIGEHIDCHTELLAEGHNTTQARVTGTTDGRIVFVALGATARPRDDGFGAAFGGMPNAMSADDCAPWSPEFPFPPDTVERRGPFATAEFRQARCDDGSVKLWSRIRAGLQDRVTIAYLGDFVPSSVLRAAGRSGGGVSLDNSIRFGVAPAPETDWILIDTEPYLADSGYVHGGARLWSADGKLLAIASQTAVAKFFD
jgi:acyl-CoA thioesterase II